MCDCFSSRRDYSYNRSHNDRDAAVNLSVFDTTNIIDDTERFEILAILFIMHRVYIDLLTHSLTPLSSPINTSDTGYVLPRCVYWMVERFVC